MQPFCFIQRCKSVGAQGWIHFQRRFKSAVNGPELSNEGVFFRLWSYYSVSLVKRPLLTKSITSGIISISADLICQKFFPVAAVTASTSSSVVSDSPSEEIKVKSSIDFQRLCKFSFIGFALVGPTLHYWYGFLGTLKFPFKSQMAKTSLRLVLDQGVFTPIFVAVFMSSVIVLEQLGKIAAPSTSSPDIAPVSTLSLIKQRLSSDYLSTLQMNYALWVPAMFANFYFVPLIYQTLFSNSVGLVWNVYLSWASYKAPPTALVDSTGAVDTHTESNVNNDTKEY